MTRQLYRWIREYLGNDFPLTDWQAAILDQLQDAADRAPQPPPVSGPHPVLRGRGIAIGRRTVDPIPAQFVMPAGWEEIGWTEGSPIRQEIADAAETRLREQEEVRYSYHDGPVTIDLHMEAVDPEAMAAWHYLFFGEPQPEREDTSSQADIVARISAEIDAWERDHGPGSAAITDLDDDYAPQRIGDVTDDPCGWRTL